MKSESPSRPVVEIVKCSEAEATAIEREAGFIVAPIPAVAMTLKQAALMATSDPVKRMGVWKLHSVYEKAKTK